MHLSDIWERIGAFGRYQWLVIAGLPFAVLATAGNFLINSFLVLEPDWSCTTDEYSFGKNCSQLHACSKLNFRSEFHSIGQQWGLLCEQAYFTHSIISLQNLASFFGLLIWGDLSDRFGRKPTCLLSTGAMILLGLLTALSNHWLLFTAFRMVFGFLQAGAGSIYPIWTMEMTDQSHGFIINAMCHWHWSYLVVSLIAYLAQTWQLYFVIMNLVCVPFLFFYAFHFTESPRWLMQTGRLEQCSKVLEKIATKNGKDWSKCQISLRDLKNADPGGEKESNFHFFSLFTNPTRGMHSACLGFVFLTASVSSGTIILDIGHLSGSVYMNLFFLGLFRLPTPLVSICLDNYAPNFGRRLFFFCSELVVFICFCMIILGTSIFAQFIPQLADPLVAVMSLGGAVLNMFVWIIIVQFCFELYPTKVRNTALAFMSLADAFGGILVPQIIFLRRFWAGAPALICAVMILAATLWGLAVFPETKGKDKIEPAAGLRHLDEMALLDEEDEEDEVVIMDTML